MALGGFDVGHQTFNDAAVIHDEFEIVAAAYADFRPAHAPRLDTTRRQVGAGLLQQLRQHLVVAGLGRADRTGKMTCPRRQ